MGVEIFTITLDNETATFSPGDVLSGKVLVKVNGDLEWASEIIVRFYGEVVTHWAKSSTSTKCNAGYELLFDLSKKLLGDANNRKVKLPMGENNFKFSLPVMNTSLPPPCKFPDGHVSYVLQAHISQPWLNKDIKSDIIHVKMLTPVDLNNVPNAENRLDLPELKTFGCFCKCQVEPLIFQSSTLKLGFCPGEEIEFLVKINNSSENTIRRVSATLVQTWVLIGYRNENDQRFHTHPITLQMFEHEDIDPRQNINWEVTFKLPDNLHPTFTDSDFVRLEYAIKVTARSAACCWRKVGLEHPIIVGSLPLGQKTTHE